MNQQTEFSQKDFHEIKISRNQNLYAFLKVLVFFAGAAVFIGLLSFSIVYPLWSFSHWNADIFAAAIGIVCTALCVFFFIFRLIRSIKEARAHDFFGTLFHITNFFIFITIHAATAVLFMQAVSQTNSTEIPVEIFFIAGLFFQTGILLNFIIGLRSALYSRGLFLFYSIVSFVNFMYWIIVFVSNLRYFYFTAEICICCSAGVVIYVWYKNPKKISAPVFDR